MILNSNYIQIHWGWGWGVLKWTNRKIQQNFYTIICLLPRMSIFISESWYMFLKPMKRSNIRYKMHHIHCIIIISKPTWMPVIIWIVHVLEGNTDHYPFKKTIVTWGCTWYIIDKRRETRWWNTHVLNIWSQVLRKQEAHGAYWSHEYYMCCI